MGSNTVRKLMRVNCSQQMKKRLKLLESLTNERRMWSWNKNMSKAENGKRLVNLKLNWRQASRRSSESEATQMTSHRHVEENLQNRIKTNLTTHRREKEKVLLMNHRQDVTTGAVPQEKAALPLAKLSKKEDIHLMLHHQEDQTLAAKDENVLRTRHRQEEIRQVLNRSENEKILMHRHRGDQKDRQKLNDETRLIFHLLANQTTHRGNEDLDGHLKSSVNQRVHRCTSLIPIHRHDLQEWQKP